MYIETQTQDIIDNVHSLKSEVGLLYLSPLNSTVIRRVLKEAHLIFEPIFETLPYACMRRDHPLGKRTGLTLPDLVRILFFPIIRATVILIPCRKLYWSPFTSKNI